MGDTYRVVVSDRAAADLSALHDYVAADSPRNAAALVRRIVRAIDGLGIFPQRYPVYEGERAVAVEIRRMPAAPMVVYYKIDEGAGTVEVITVHHGARRPPSSLS